MDDNTVKVIELLCHTVFWSVFWIAMAGGFSKVVINRDKGRS